MFTTYFLVYVDVCILLQGNDLITIFLVGEMRVCWCNQMEGCYMWGVYEVKTEGTNLLLSFVSI